MADEPLGADELADALAQIRERTKGDPEAYRATADRLLQEVGGGDEDEEA